MQIELRFFANFRAAVGQKTVEREYPDGASVGEVLAAIEDEWPELAGDILDGDGSILPQLSVLKNGREVVHMDGPGTPLEDGDRLSVFPPVAGGANPDAEVSPTPADDAADGTDAADAAAPARTVEKTYRGISKRLALEYLDRLGGEVPVDPDETSADGTVTRVAGDGWTADVSAEKVAAAGSIRLTEVRVVVEGEPAAVEELVEAFSRKAMRAGG
jgi:molybdopterin synthase sulfur carrier subunit